MSSKVRSKQGNDKPGGTTFTWARSDWSLIFGSLASLVLNNCPWKMKGSRSLNVYVLFGLADMLA